MNTSDLELYLVTNPLEDEDKFLNTIEESLKGGVTIVQLREKDKDTGDFYNIAVKVKEITDKYDVPLIINDRIDIMLAIDCAGIHIGQSDMPCNIAREMIGNEKIIGVSAHSIAEAKKAQEDGADYLGCGAVYPTKTKKNANHVPKEMLNDIADSVDIPIVAIGGINLENAMNLAGTDIAGLCVVSAIMNAENPKKASEKLLEISKNIINED
ncbi:MAG: thiamine phosphate synthase [Methanobrevibacter sp.]|uniref:thiamine phosphate synthase n=1 Tax=Methanobrevibacter sp. TaxID=66852 RepID=UPI0026DEAD76|nr:thiamine phosphate synthase [Methanobrevibacter sp.]MDO5848241.1 thiamine phosphate synthase [Methanobrevibacter sp.]